MEKTPPSPLGLRRSRAKRQQWKLKYMQNRSARSAFNAEWKGECKNRNANSFHEGLKALSLGLGGK